MTIFGAEEWVEEEMEGIIVVCREILEIIIAWMENCLVLAALSLKYPVGIKFVFYFTRSALALILTGNMVERAGQVTLFPEVELAKQLITRVSDFTAISSLSEILPNLRNLADAFVGKGKIFSEVIR